MSLRNLSMVLRQVGETEEERLNNVCESVAKAKEALQLDITDGKTWSKSKHVEANNNLMFWWS